MGRPRKIIEEVNAEVIIGTPIPVPTIAKVPIALFDIKLGREELDKLADKLNEVINHLNG